MNNKLEWETLEDEMKAGRSWSLTTLFFTICVGVLIILIINGSTSQGPIKQDIPPVPTGSTITPTPNPNPSAQPPIPTGQITTSGDSSCKSFDYSRWSHCATDGTQSRVITAAYPDGCILSDNSPNVQQQRCTYVPINLTATEIINRMVGQIYNAKDQTISTEYFTGQGNDVYITTNKWKLSSDTNGTTLFLEATSKSRTTGAVTDHIILADNNGDFRPDNYSSDGDHWPNLADQDPLLIQNYTTVWTLASAFFASYLLDI